MSMRDLEVSLLLKLADRMSGPAKKVGAVSGHMAKQIRKSQEQLKKLNQTAKKVKHMQQLGKELNATTGKMTQAQKRLRGLQQEIRKTTNPTKKMRQALTAAARSVNKLSTKQLSLRKRLHSTRKELRGAGIDTGKLGRAQAKLAEKTNRVNRRLEKQKKLLRRIRAAGSKVSGLWGKMRTGAFMATGVGSAAGAMGLPFIKEAAKFEDYQAVMETLEGGDVGKAKKSLAWAETFTAKTPYQIDEVTASFVKLRSYGLDPTNGLLKTLGDTGAGMNKSMDQAVEAIADAMTGENERLKEFGIKGSKGGGEITYDYTDKKGVQKQIKVAADNRKAIEKALRSIWDEKFGGAMEKKSKTMNGIVSNLMDIWSRFMRMVANSGPFEKLKKYLSGLLEKLNEMDKNGSLQAWASKIGKKVISATKAIRGFFSGLWWLITTIRSAIAPLAEFVGGWDKLVLLMATMTMVPVVNSLIMVGTALTVLGTAAMAHPIIALISLLAMGAVLIITNWSKVRAWLAPVFDWMASMGDKIRFNLAGIKVSLSQAFNWMANVGNTIRDKWTTMLTFFQSLPAKFKAIGAAMMEGLKQGIVEKIQWIKEKIQSLGNLMPAWLKEKLAIKSPSRVFVAIGSQVSEGVAVGIQQRARLAMGAVKRMGQQLPKAIPAMAAGAALAASPVMAAGAGAAQQSSVTIHVYAAPGMDEQALASMVARKMEEVQRKTRRSSLYD